MSTDWDTSPEWIYLGSSYISGSVNRVPMPIDVFEKGILRPEEAEDTDMGLAHWSYDTATGWIVMSDRDLDEADDILEGKLVDGGVETVRYKNPGDGRPTKPGDENDGHRITIPNGFFEGKNDDSAGVPDAVRLEHADEVHFVTATEFLSEDPTPAKSCYVLSTEQLNTILREDYDPKAGDTPQFI